MQLLIIICTLLSLPCTYPGAFAQTATEGNTPFKSSYSKVAEGASVLGVYDGRCPCTEIAKQLKIKRADDCIKLKWRLSLFKDPVTQLATTYKLEGTLFRDAAAAGTVTMLKGNAAFPDADIYQLNNVLNKATLLLMKGDDNVLFFLDEEKNFYVGNSNFSFTLNRVIN